VFNVGYEGGEFVSLLLRTAPGLRPLVSEAARHTADACETSLSPELLHAIARVGGTIATTIYPPRMEVPSRRPKKLAAARGKSW
jgi:hypothetical protein